MVVTTSGNQFRLNNRRWRAVLGNYYSLCYTTSIPDDATLEAQFKQCVRDGVTALRCWIYNEPNRTSTQNATGVFRYRDTTSNTLLWREAQFAYVDKVLYFAAKYQVPLILSFADCAESRMFDKYRAWHDALNGTHILNGQTISVTSLSRTSNVVTGTTAVAHELYVGCLLEIAGAVEAGFNGQAIKCLSVIDSTHFTYAATGSNGSATGTKTMKRGDSFWSPVKQTFYHLTGMKTYLKEMIAQCVNRVSTVDGITWKDHPGILSLELCNEPRYDQTNETNVNSASSNNVQSMLDWVSELSAYAKGQDGNHMVSIGDIARSAGYNQVGGDSSAKDQVFSGSQYGIDLLTMGAVSSVDFVDAHIYPYQFDNNSLHSGNGYFGVNALGEAGTERGYYAGIAQLLSMAKNTVGKPFAVTEYGVVKTNTYAGVVPAYPRYLNARQAMKFFFDNDGDIFGWWHYYGSRDYGLDDSYGIQSQGAYPNTAPFSSLPAANKTDAEILSTFNKYGSRWIGRRRILT